MNIFHVFAGIISKFEKDIAYLAQYMKYFYTFLPRFHQIFNIIPPTATQWLKLNFIRCTPKRNRCGSRINPMDYCGIIARRTKNAVRACKVSGRGKHVKSILALQHMSQLTDRSERTDDTYIRRRRIQFPWWTGVLAQCKIKLRSIPQLVQLDTCQPHSRCAICVRARLAQHTWVYIAPEESELSNQRDMEYDTK